MNSLKYPILLIVALMATVVLSFHFSEPPLPGGLSDKMPREARKKARAEYFYHTYKNPKTQEIPRNIRHKELQFVRESQQLLKSTQATVPAFNWAQAGPFDVSGRTRGLAVDISNTSVLLAGGASGGIWRSTNKGSSWTLVTPDYPNLGVTYIAQDPRQGNTNIWYATSGEFDGSAQDLGFRAFHYGTGIFKSTDGGQTWAPILFNPDDQRFSSFFDYLSKVMVHPTTGHVYVASNGGGIMRSTDGGASFSTILPSDIGGDVTGIYYYSELDIAPNGRIFASLGAPDGRNTTTFFEGVYVSDDGGNSWTDVTPEDFPSGDRTIVAIAPSSADVAYSLTRHSDGYALYRYNLGTGTNTNRTDNMPNFGGAAGDYNSQRNYNMVMAIHPTNPNFVLIGGTNLYRTFDGFATPTASENTQTLRTRHWIGGYTNTGQGFGLYPSHHPDQHSLFFDPDNENGLYSGQDGGVSYTSNVQATSVSWDTREAGYVVTQYYHASMRKTAGARQIVGGTQDNGSPFFYDRITLLPSEDITSGDGSFTHYGNQVVYASSQNARVIRYDLSGSGDPTSFPTQINPSVQNARFIHPFAVDPNDDNLMYFPDGNFIWRGTNVAEGETSNQLGWTSLADLVNTGNPNLVITALEVSKSPADILYYGGTDQSREPSLPPTIFRLDDASTSTSPVQITLPGAEIGAYVHDIAINPEDANEAFFILSNYGIESIYYTNDGGTTVTGVEGNLSGTEELPGPSVRGGFILPFRGETIYIVGTSTGVYTTRSINGSSTEWVHEGTSSIGNSIINTIDGRTSDGKVIAASHGRGIFIGEPNSTVSNENGVLIPADFDLEQNYPNPFNPSTTIAYSLPESGSVTLTLFDISGRRVQSLINGVSQTAGKHSFQFNASGLASGNYIYRLESVSSSGARYVSSKQLTLVK